MRERHNVLSMINLPPDGLNIHLMILRKRGGALQGASDIQPQDTGTEERAAFKDSHSHSMVAGGLEEIS